MSCCNTSSPKCCNLNKTHPETAVSRLKRRPDLAGENPTLTETRESHLDRGADLDPDLGGGT